MGGFKIFWLLSGFTFVFAATGFAAFDTSINLIATNPGFESGQDGWFTGGGTIDNTEASEGSASAKLVSTGAGNNGDWRSQKYYTVTPGELYRLSFDYKTEAGATGNPQIRFRFFGGGQFKGEAQRTLDLTNGAWVSSSDAEYTCPVDAEYFDIFFSVSTFGEFAGTTWLDNTAVNPWGDVVFDHFPPDGTEGWSDELTFSWQSTDSASAYLFYLGTNLAEITAARFFPSDIDFDGQVGTNDLMILAQQWLGGPPSPPGPSADIDTSGQVDTLDFSLLARDWTGMNSPGVFQAEISQSTYEPPLLLDQDYYWRVDAVIDDEIQVGPVRSFRCADYLDYNIAAPTRIFYVDNGYLSRTQQVMFQTLQGLVARVEPALFIRNNSNQLWLNDLHSQYRVNKTDISMIAGAAGPLAWALDYFAAYYSSYILCDAYNDADSLTAAVCLAAALPDSIVVDITDVSLMTSRNVPMAYDARGRDEKWVWDQFSNNFTREAIFVQRNDVTAQGAHLRDLPVTLGALTWWHENLIETEAVFSDFKANIPLYGWESPVAPGEDNAIAFHSEYGMYTIPADWMLNLSLFAGTASLEPEIEFTQPCSDNTYTPEGNVHYVTFLMSDMDNANTIFSGDGWAQNSLRYGSSHRGQFAMGWGMPPVMMQIGPTVMKWWYDNAYETDCFISYCSGLDYFHPSKFPELQLHMSHLDKYLRKADLSTLCILDNYSGPMTSEAYTTGQLYGQLDNLRGFFLGYDHGNGDILWFNGKPMVTGRYALWADRRVGVCDNGINLAASINALPTDPYSSDGYTFVIVHAWSYGWDEVATCIASLESDVRVVTPNELIEQIYLHNLAPN